MYRQNKEQLLVLAFWTSKIAYFGVLDFFIIILSKFICFHPRQPYNYYYERLQSARPHGIIICNIRIRQNVQTSVKRGWCDTNYAIPGHRFFTGLHVIIKEKNNLNNLSLKYFYLFEILAAEVPSLRAVLPSPSTPIPARAASSQLMLALLNDAYISCHFSN